ncbi:SID1 transmembrane family member 1-like [Sycon ciliatum]|uniref:SID1 transmembrane family member 1-like n=1 Tax=Sycon ciliatum TaxID=27933 RepID=UPI0031F61966
MNREMRRSALKDCCRLSSTAGCMLLLLLTLYQRVNVAAELIQGDINTVYEDTAWDNHEDTFSFTWTSVSWPVQGTGATPHPRPLRVSVSSGNASANHHLTVLVRSRNAAREIFWSIPFSAEGPGSATYKNSSRIICPNLPVSTDSGRVNGTKNSTAGVNQTVLVEIAATTEVRIGYTLLAAPVDDFNLAGGKKHAVNLSPSSPVYYSYSFQPGDDQVTVEIEASESTCGIASVQEALCPVFDLASNIQYSGAYQTFSSSATLLVQRTDFQTDSFYIVLAGLSSDAQCSSRHRPQYEDGEDAAPFYNETVYIRVAKHSQSYATPVIVPLVIYFGIYFSTLVTLVIYYYVYKKDMGDVSLAGFILGSDVHVVIPDTNNGAGRSREESVRSTASVYHGAQDTVPCAGSGKPELTSMSVNHQHFAGGEDQVEAATETARAQVQPSAQPPRAAADTEQAAVDTEQAATDIEQAATDIEQAAADTEQAAVDQGPENTRCTPPCKARTPTLSLADVEKTPPEKIDKQLNNSPWLIGIVGIYYGVPVIQLVANYQQAIFKTGDQDLCYFNFRCNRRYGRLTAFNAVFSNIGYILLGILFILLTIRRQRVFTRTVEHNLQRLTSTGVLHHQGLLYALGLALCLEGVLSACYHVCPTPVNFQFDTSFMYVIIVLSFLHLHQGRNPDAIKPAHHFLAFLCTVVVIVLAGVLGNSQVFWIIFFIVYVGVDLIVHIRMYYTAEKRLKERFTDARQGRSKLWETYPRRVFHLLLSFLLNLGLAIYGIADRPGDFPTYMLGVLGANLVLYVLYYFIALKAWHCEKCLCATFVYGAASVVFFIPAGYFFKSNVSNWAESPSGSRKLNQDCLIFDFYDNHDLWHFLGAIAIFFYYLMLLSIDDPLENVKRQEIPTW